MTTTTRLSALLMLWLLLHSSFATDFYVISSGNNGSAGTSPGTAWATHTFAAANTTVGDRIFVLGGKFTESFTETSDGTSTNAAACVQWVWTAATTLDGSITTSGNFTRWYGNNLLTVTNNNDQGMTVSSGTLSNFVSGIRFVEIEDEGLWIQSSSHGTFIHDVYIDNPSASTWPSYSGGTINACVDQDASGTNSVIQYITMDRTPDYLEVAGQWNRYRHIVAGPNTGTTTAAHVDAVQMSAGCADCLIEYLWHYGNRTDDNHINNIDNITPSNDRNRWRYLVSMAKGGAQWFGSDNDRIYNWTLFTNKWETSTFQINGGAATTDLQAINSLFWYSNPAVGGEIWAGSVTHSYNGSFGNPGWDAETGEITSDFEFTDIPTTNLTLQSTSPARGAARYLTLINGNQTASVINVDDALWLFPGDIVLLGADQRTVLRIASTTSIEVDSSVTVADNEEVVLVLNSNKDMGAYPYGASYLTACTHTAVGTSYTATPVGEVEFVQFSENGIPTSWDGTAPYTYSSSGGTVTVRAFAKWAQNPMAFDSTLSQTATGVIATGAPLIRGAARLR